MDKVRIYDLAKELSVSPKEILDMLGSIGVTNRVASSSIPPTAADSVRQIVTNKRNPGAGSATAVAEAPAPVSESRTEAAPARPTTPPANQGGGARTENRTDNRNGDNRNGASGQHSNGSHSGGGARPNDNRSNDNRPAQSQSGQGGQSHGAPNRDGQSGPRPAGQGGQGGGYGNRPPGQGGGQNGPRPAGQGGGYGNRPPGQGNRPGGNRPGGGNRGPRPAAAPGAPGAPQTPADSPFAMGSRDRRQQKQGKYRGNNRDNRGFGRREEIREEAPLTAADMKIVVQGETGISVNDLAVKMRKPAGVLIKDLLGMGQMRAANAPLELDLASQLVAKYGFTIEREATRAEVNVLAEENPDELVSVPPVVVVMGHVDHGKTSLLDRIRSANIQSGEAGGITQRIGAYEAFHNGQRMVFLDTPGHEAFTRMRARGANVTDIAILVVAADDGIMPQTREAIDHARAAKVPIIVAMNKIDKADANPDRIYAQLSEVGLIPTAYGGDIEVIPVSAKTGEGVQDLLDTVLIVSELLDLKANPTGLATGTVIEARQDQNRGPVATVLLHRGTLHVGDSVVIGDVYGRVRAMLDYKGANLEEAGPKTPVFITGLSGVPHASDRMRATETSREAREAAEKFLEDSRSARDAATMRRLEDLYDLIKKGDVQDLNLIVKADGQGSVEALAASLEKISHAEVRPRIKLRGVGPVTENDVNLAAATGSIIIAFAIGVDSNARLLADREGVQIREYSVIYQALDDTRAALEGMLKPIYEEKYSGEAEVRALFKSTKAGTIAGCLVLDGKFVKGAILRVFRNKKQIFEGKVDSLRHYKEEVKEMVGGQECGISTNGFNDLQEGDVLRCFVMEQIKRTLD